ncbi:DUF4129 domain-containing protein [Kordiimonas lacus]|uniref:Protein-glutamine gamma-glutamyltransferase-like C-terminal domain-containing protein n=1 Tax=Kordiimonas lacus TaxID=637679 RepID=A0A1G6U7D1_9PROT|nr:DUF4129 domain-containing protein [Kordiimonas lacus]SDD37193.1 protein of unknown function [Kordiimonas lacus]
MTGGFKKGISKNWRQLAILAAVSIGLLGLAYWWDTERGKDGETSDDVAADSVQLKAPLPDTELGRQVDTMLEGGGYQRSLPELEKPKPTRKSNPLPRWLGDLIVYALVGLGLFAIAVMIWVLVTGSTSPKIRTRKPRRSTVRKGAAPAGTHALAQPASLDDAEKAAKAGNFGEAVRLLLATALIGLARQELVRLRPWMTGREIVRDAKLAPSPADALGFLVATVEAYAFAGHVITEQTYKACFQRYQLLVQAGKGTV